MLSGGAPGNAFDFLGGLGYWSDPDLGLHYVRARWLNPQFGSWMSVDPHLDEFAYQYANNMPTTTEDPSGTQTLSPDDRVLASRALHGNYIDRVEPYLEFLAKVHRAPTLEDAASRPERSAKTNENAHGPNPNKNHPSQNPPPAPSGMPSGPHHGSGHAPPPPDSHRMPGQGANQPPLPAYDPRNPQALLDALAERRFQKQLSLAKAHGDSNAVARILAGEETAAIHSADIQRGIELHENPNWFLNKPLPMGSASDLVKSTGDALSLGVTKRVRHAWYGSDTGGDPNPYTQWSKTGSTIGTAVPAVANLIAPGSPLALLPFYAQTAHSVIKVAQGKVSSVDALNLGAALLHTGVVGKAMKAVPAYVGPFRRLDQYAQEAIGKSDALYKGTPGGLLEPRFASYPTSIGEYLTPTNIKAAIARSYVNNRGLVLGYRGSANALEGGVFHETGHLLSDAAKVGYREAGNNLASGYAAAIRSHAEWMRFLGNSEDDYAQLHSLFGGELTKQEALQQLEACFRLLLRQNVRSILPILEEPREQSTSAS